MTGLDDFAADATAADLVPAITAKLDNERRQHQATRRELARAAARVGELETLMDRYQTIKPADARVPK